MPAFFGNVPLGGVPVSPDLRAALGWPTDDDGFPRVFSVRILRRGGETPPPRTIQALVLENFQTTILGSVVARYFFDAADGDTREFILANVTDRQGYAIETTVRVTDRFGPAAFILGQRALAAFDYEVEPTGASPGLHLTVKPEREGCFRI